MIRNTLYIVFLTIFFVLFYPGCSPHRDIDINLTKSDSIKSFELTLRTNPAEVIHKVDSALLTTTDSMDYYSLLTIKSKAKFILADLDAVKLLNKRILQFCEHNKNSEGINELLSGIYNLSGNYFSRIALADTANKCYLRAYVAARSAHKSSLLPDIAINVADSYVRKGRLDMGAYWYWKSIALSDSVDIPESKRYPSYFGLAQVYMELRDYKSCDSLYNIAGRYFDDMEPFEKHIYLNNRGNSFYYRGDYTTALDYFIRSKELVQRIPSMTFEQHLTHINLGEIYLLLNQTDSAAYYLNSCQNFFRKINNVTAQYYIDTQLIELALKQGDVGLASKRIREAIKPDYIEPNMLLIRNKFLEHYYKEKGDYKLAYHYHVENQHIDDSIRNERIKMRSSEVALKYRLNNALMKQEILIRQQENKMLRLHEWMYILIFGALTIVAFSWGLLLYRRRKNEKKLWNMQTAINKLRLDNVRNRISPHFIFNVLNHEMNRFKNDTDKNNLHELVRLIRRNLELADQIVITLDDELDFVKSFLTLEKGSLGNNFYFELTVDETLDLKKIYIPSMCLYILVENAVKHSLLNKEGVRKLWIKILDETDAIVIRLCDNGGGFKHNQTHNGTGTGYKIITKTIQLFNLYNKTSLTMQIHNVKVGDGETGCEVVYTMPKGYTFNLKE